MTIHRSLISAALSLAFLGAAQPGNAEAKGLRPVEAQAIDLGGVAGIAFYTVEQDGFHVVATFTEAEKGGTPFRVEAVLARGQSVTFSTPHAAGVARDAVTISRHDDQVRLQRTALTN